MVNRYYIRENHCEYCNRWTAGLLIGLEDVGYSFLFRGYAQPKLHSWQDWKQYLPTKQIMLANTQVEYLDFVDIVERTKPEFWNDVVTQPTWQYFTPHTDWQDGEGYQFTLRNL